MKLSQSFLSLVKGGIIGISSLIPCLSSGSVMYSLSVYNKFIEGISNIFKKSNRALYIIVIPMLLGIIGGLLGGVNAINYFYVKFPNQTIFLFIGLLLGGLKLGYNNSKIKINLKNIFIFLLIVTVVIAVYLIFSKYISVFIPNNLFFKFILGLFIGITILIPGIPISSLMTSLNKYEYINSMVNGINLSNILALILFSFGIIVGIIVIARLIQKLFKKYNTKTSLVYLALLLASIIILVLHVESFKVSFSSIFTCVLAFLWGYILAINLEKEND